MALAKRTLWYGLRAHGASVSGYLNARLDLLIMPAFLSATSVGLYSVATNVSWIVFVVPGSVAAVLLPVATRRKESGAAPATVLRSMWSTLAVAAAFALVIGLVAGFGVRLVYGNEFRGSVEALRILLPGCVFYAAAFCLISGLYSSERPFTAAVLQAVGLALSAVALFVFLPSGGIVAASIISTAAYTLVFVLAAISYCRVEGLRWSDLRPPADTFALRPLRRGAQRAR
jgi:O-antigen/teichoic acid export membrane protein